MRLRAATAGDLATMTELQRRFDVTWFGAPEHDEDEVGEEFDLADAHCVVHDGARLVAYGLRHRTGSSLVIDPAAEPARVHGLLLPWLAEVKAPEIDVLERDEPLRAALSAGGWRYVRSGFELLRPVTADWVLPAPRWPDGVEVRPYRAADAPRVHRLIYDDAGWAEVSGHYARDFAEWRQIFLAGRGGVEEPVVAWRGDAAVGTAIGRLHSDGAGWVSQLAVARAERGRGLGRALLLEAFRRRVGAGATTLGLGVIATNRGPLRLYLDVGLPVEREWQVYRAPSAR